MLDVFGIFVSGVLMWLVIVRAVQLDRTRPWFETAEPETEESKGDPGRRPKRPARSLVRPPGRRS